MRSSAPPCLSSSGLEKKKKKVSLKLEGNARARVPYRMESFWLGQEGLNGRPISSSEMNLTLLKLHCFSTVETLKKNVFLFNLNNALARLQLTSYMLENPWS